MSINLNIPTVSQQALDLLSSQGLSIPTSTPITTPVLPLDITEIDDESLMELFTSFTAFLDFVSYQLALAEIDEKDVDKRLDYAINSAIASQPKALASVIKATASSHPDVVKLSEEQAVKYNYRKLIETMVENLTRDSMLISRELTRRTSGGTPMTRARKFIT